MPREDERRARTKSEKSFRTSDSGEADLDFNTALSRHRSRQAAASSTGASPPEESQIIADEREQRGDSASLSGEDTHRSPLKDSHDRLRVDTLERGEPRPQSTPKQRAQRERLRQRLDPAARPDAPDVAELPILQPAPEHRVDGDLPEDITEGSDVPTDGSERLRFGTPGTDGDRPQSAPSSATAPGKRGRLQFTENEDAPPVTARQSKKLAVAQNRSDRANSKAAAAHRKLPKKHSIKVSKGFSAESGKVKRTLRFESEVKSKHAHVKGSLPLRPVKFAGNAIIGQGHRKLYQVEQENVGAQAAHKGELAAESGLRTAYRLHKTAPYRKAERLERSAARKSVKLSYQKTVADNPKLQSNVFSRISQKRKIKKEYAKAVRESKRAGKAAKKAAEATEKTVVRIVSAVNSHPVVIAAIAGIALIAVIISSLVASFTNMASGGVSTALAASYLAADAEIESAELSYTEWETDLQIQIASAEASHPGFDEYRYNIGDISHDPYELMAYLTAKYQGFASATAQSELTALFGEQYQLTFAETTETRYADPTDSDDDGDYEPYDWRVLSVTLTTRSFTVVISNRMTGEQLQSFDILMLTNGSRQYIANPFDFDWLPYVTSYYGWRVHPISGAKDLHRGIDIGVPVGTEVRSGQDGTVTFAGYSGDYGNVVVIENDKGLISKYAHCDSLLVTVGQTVSVGEVIAKSGNTGSSMGPHLHLEILKDGQYLNPLYFALTGNEGVSSIPPGRPGGVAFPEYPGEPMTDAVFTALMEEAQKHLGKPYIFGASGPSAFDCSGFACYVINTSGIASVGRVGATDLFFNYTTPVSRENAKPGDLIFFEKTYSVSKPITHVGIYIGNGMMIHAGSPVQYASIDSAYFTEHFYSFGRLSVG
ncbi:MAG: peptidoglycan DD-metalloendopeptidase family protein [Oscillospiraceae bacterium]|jgi:murein DD-endopeptidase MepM/ murein hydrolase activator NlpD|nr:peptidoglycan DD-metalloendopeptidase family protein [Oscillospiraceae bacterium]